VIYWLRQRRYLSSEAGWVGGSGEYKGWAEGLRRWAAGQEVIRRSSEEGLFFSYMQHGAE